MHRLKTAIVACAASVIGCSAAEPFPSQLDVYFRAFESTLIVTMDRAKLEDSSDKHAVIVQAAEIALIAKSLDGPCKQAPDSEAPKDLRLLVKASGSASWLWEASQFTYRDSRNGKVCRLPPEYRAQLLALLRL